MTDGASVPSRPTSSHSQSAIGVQAIPAGMLGLMLLLTLTACASGPKFVNHAFGFDAVNDSPGMEVIAYNYFTKAQSIISSASAVRQFGKAHQGTNVNGPLPLGDFLYVKWRDKGNGQTYEDTVELRPLLPREMTYQRIHFFVNSTKLYVYLIDPVPRPKDWPVVGPPKFQNEKIRQIYPGKPPSI